MEANNITNKLSCYLEEIDNSKNNTHIYVIMGPTASSKSKLASFLLDYLGGSSKAKIINFDAYQIYKEMDIGTAKPSKEDLDLLSPIDNTKTLLLYDYLLPSESNDIYFYQNISRELIRKYITNYNLIFVGGSGLYIKASLFDYHLYQEDDNQIKYNEKEYELKYKDLSNIELYNKLLILDKNDALRIGNNNRKRLLRSLYINEHYHLTKDELNDNGKDRLYFNNTSNDLIKFIYINPSKEILDKRIRERVEEVMFKDNLLLNEVKSILTKYGSSSNSFKAIGYKEFIDKDNNNLIRNDLDNVKEEIIRNTIKYAKRQRTFFNHQFNSVNVNQYNSVEDAIKNIEDYI